MLTPPESPFYARLRTVSHHVTWWMGQRFTRAIPLVFVLGFPKSGTTWVSQITADYLQLPFPKFSLLPIGFPAVVHGHERVTRRYPRGVYAMRDGRDALTSMFFYVLRRIPEGQRRKLSRRQRRIFPGFTSHADKQGNFNRFVEAQMKRPHIGINWGDHVLSYYEAANPGMVLLKYEDLRLDGPRTFASAMRDLTGRDPDMDRIQVTLDRFSFDKQSGRKAGQEDAKSFLRKGQVGDWRNHFTIEAAEMFAEHCGDALIRAGYEPDAAWLDQFRRERQAASPADTPISAAP